MLLNLRRARLASPIHESRYEPAVKPGQGRNLTLVSGLILRNAVVNLICPGANPAFNALGVFEPLFFEKLHRFQRPHSTFAMDVNGLIRIQLSKTLRE